MLHEWHPKQTLFAKVSGKRLVGRPSTRWLDYIKGLGWNHLGLYPSETQSVLVDRKLWRLNLELLLLQPPRKSGRKKIKKTHDIHNANESVCDCITALQEMRTNEYLEKIFESVE